MAKSKRKIYSTQRDKEAIEIAKILKRKGVLSKQTKLHGGKYISRAALSKVRKYWFAASDDYKVVEVSKETVKKAREQDYISFSGNKLLVPSDKRFIKRLKSGQLSGVRPIKGGTMQEVHIPFTGSNVQDLVWKLQNDDLDDLKLPDEQFAFTITDESGRGGMSLRAFPTATGMKDYLQYYRHDLPTSAIKFFRLKTEDIPLLIKGPERRRKDRISTQQDRRSKARVRKPWHYPENMPANRAKMFREAQNKRQQERRERLAKDPAKLQELRDKAKERSKKWREANKARKK